MMVTLYLMACLQLQSGNCHTIEVPLGTFVSKDACNYAGSKLPFRKKENNDPIFGYSCRDAPLIIMDNK